MAPLSFIQLSIMDFFSAVALWDSLSLFNTELAAETEVPG